MAVLGRSRSGGPPPDQILDLPLGGGGRARRTPPMGPNSFIFAYIFTKKCPHRRSMPPQRVHAPPMGNPGSATAYNM